MDWMGGRTDGLADYIHIEDRARCHLRLFEKKLSLKCFNLKMLGFRKQDSHPFGAWSLEFLALKTYYESNSLKPKIETRN